MEKYFSKIFITSAKITTYTMLLPIVVAIWQRRYLNNALRVFLYYCIASFLLALLEQGVYWATDNYWEFLKPFFEYYEISSLNFFQIFFVLKNYIFLAWFYFLILPKKYGIGIKYLAIFLSTASIINYLFIEGYHVIGVFNPIAESIFRIIIPAFYLWFLFKNLIHFPIKKNPYFWFSFGLALSNLVTLFYYLIANSIYKPEFILFTKLGIAKNGFEIIALILFSIGFWHAPYVKFVEHLNKNFS